MKKELIRSIKIVVIALILGLGVSYLSFQNPEKSLAGGIAPILTHKACVSNACTTVTGAGVDDCAACCVSQGSKGSAICTPVDEGSTSQVKVGGLVVGKFEGVGSSSIANSSSDVATYIANVAGANPALNVVGGDLTAGVVRIESLGGGGISTPICADSNGKIFLCAGAAGSGACGAAKGSCISGAPTTVHQDIYGVWYWNCVGGDAAPLCSL